MVVVYNIGSFSNMGVLYDIGSLTSNMGVVSNIGSHT